MYDLLCKACTDRGLAYGASGRIYNNLLYVRYVHLTKGQAYSLETKSSCQTGCYIRTISDRDQQGTWRQEEMIGGKPPAVKQLWLWQLVQCSAVQCSAGNWSVDWWVSDLAREQQFGRCELFLLETGSWGTRTVLELRRRGKSVVGSRYQATTGEDNAHTEDLVHAVVNCRVLELAIAL
jgi:hypothetical protein